MKSVVIIAIAFVLLFIPLSVFAVTDIENIMSNYKLKGDTYEKLDYPYMAFLNYDKANYQPGKNINYNKWNDYKSFLDSIDENIENYSMNDFQNIISRSFQVADYQTTIKYSDIAIQKYPTFQEAYVKKIQALTFLGEFEEAWLTLEKAGIEEAIPILSGSYTDHKIMLLYAMGNYEGVIEFFENWSEYTLSLGGYGLPPGASTPIVATAYEKLGYTNIAEYWYGQDYLGGIDPECQKVGFLFRLGLHQKYVDAMESNDTFEKCASERFEAYIISKDIVTGQYRPPIEHPNQYEMSESSISIPLTLPPKELDPDPCRYYESQLSKEPDAFRYMNEFGYRQAYDEQMNNLRSQHFECLKTVPTQEELCENRKEIVFYYRENPTTYQVDGEYQSVEDREYRKYLEMDCPSIAGSVKLSEKTGIVCGKGTVLKDGFCVPERETMTTEMQQKSSGGGCLIATATFGSELAPQVQQLREIRDNSLLQTESGSAFMESFNQLYYSFSPGIADLERENPVFKEAVKLTITPLLSSLSLLNHVDMDSESEVLGYGISLILLNVGMYFVIPAIVIIMLKKNLIHRNY